MEKTAIRQLIEIFKTQLKEDDFDPWYGGLKWALREAESLEPVNEQQIKDAWKNGASTLSASNATVYFNQTFEK